MTKKYWYTTCTFPDENVNYFSSPDARGTLDILWSCLGILLLCTWSIQRLNVPIQTEVTGGKHWYGRSQWWGRMGQRFYKKAKWMLITVAAPELILGKALADRFSADFQTREMKKWADKDNVSWTVTHSYFANMGGFRVHFDKDLPQNDDEQPSKNENAAQGTEIRDFSVNGPVHNTLPVIAEHSISGPSEVMSPALNSSHVPVSSSSGLGGITSGALHVDTNVRPQISRNISGAESFLSNSTMSPVLFQPQLRRSTTLVITDNYVTKRAKRFNTGLVFYTSPSTLQSEFHDFRKQEKLFLLGLEKHFERSFWGKTGWEQALLNRKIVKDVSKGVPSKAITQNDAMAFFRNVTMLSGNQWILDAAQLRLARQFNVIESLPTVTEDQIQDKSKSDFLVNFVAIVQILWLIVQLIARAVRRLPVSQLEIVALAFSVCSLITYGLQWSKPKDCQYAFRVKAVAYPNRAQLISIAAAGPQVLPGLIAVQGWIPNNSVHMIGPDRPRWWILPEKTWKYCGGPRFIFASGSTFGAAVFGALHCIAWDSPFPTHIERRIWHGASIAATVTPVVGTQLHLLVGHMLERAIQKSAKRKQSNVEEGIQMSNIEAPAPRNGNVKSDTNGRRRSSRPSEEQRKRRRQCTAIKKYLFAAAMVFFGFVYLISRLYITVEVFRALCFLPPRAFVATWASNVPHIF